MSFNKFKGLFLYKNENNIQMSKRNRSHAHLSDTQPTIETAEVYNIKTQ